MIRNQDIPTLVSPAMPRPGGCLTIDVEDWFHILDSHAAPPLDDWHLLPDRVQRNVETILEFLSEHHVRATMFWLGWVARRHPTLVRKCLDQGHEIASHGYAHVLPYQAGPFAFRQDVVQAKEVLEDIISQPVRGFRAPGFGITESSAWAFNVIREAGHEYDASVFPAARAHGGMHEAPMQPHPMPTASGRLTEIPMSVVQLRNRRFCLFSGGYLRLAPLRLIDWGVHQVAGEGRPIIVLVHPREIDPDHPRLPLGLLRRFKSYVGLRSTLPKLRWLCAHCDLRPMGQLAERIGGVGLSEKRIAG
jgi:polysaccharide deacetylase family protein (PEP-CTERM system associated)